MPPALYNSAVWVYNYITITRISPKKHRILAKKHTKICKFVQKLHFNTVYYYIS